MDDQNTIKVMNVLLISKVDNIQNPCLSLKSGFFLYFIGLLILLSWTNMAPKIYRDLSALGWNREMNQLNWALESVSRTRNAFYHLCCTYLDQ